MLDAITRDYGSRTITTMLAVNEYRGGQRFDERQYLIDLLIGWPAESGHRHVRIHHRVTKGPKRLFLDDIVGHSQIDDRFYAQFSEFGHRRFTGLRSTINPFVHLPKIQNSKIFREATTISVEYNEEQS